MWPSVTCVNEHLQHHESVTLCAIVGTRQEYCNSLLYGSTDCNLSHLQRAQNILAHHATGSTICKHHWFAAAVALAFRQAADCLQNGFSQFQSENPRSTGIPTWPVTEYQPTRTLRSSISFSTSTICAYFSLISRLLCCCACHLELTDCKHQKC